MENLLGALAVFGLFIIVIIIAIYVAQAIFLNKFNRLVNGKGTAMAWIPIANLYLLGKLTFNKIVGWGLVICSFLTSSYTTTINGVETTHSILPESISSLVSTLYNFAVLGLFIYAIIKYNKIKKSSVNNQNIQQNVNMQNQQQSQTQSNVSVQQQPMMQPINMSNTEQSSVNNQNIQQNVNMQNQQQSQTQSNVSVQQQPMMQPINMSNTEQSSIDNNPNNNLF